MVSSFAGTNIPTLAGIFVDAYLMQYVETKSDARKGLVSSIKLSMDMQDPSWALTEMVIATRLEDRVGKNLPEGDRGGNDAVEPRPKTGV